MAQAPPILIYTPGGGVSTPIGSNPPVYSQAGTTALIEGQDYLDVVFGSIQTDDEWVLVGCIVVNEIDVDPLNIWPGIITDKTEAGFRIYFNGMPDSGNYYLHWSVSGVNIEPSLATTYYLTGPATGVPGEAVTYTVSLPPSTYVNSSVIVTPAEGGLEIGVFSPETVTLTTASPSATFTFTPASYGATTITVNNDRGLTDPADLAFTCVVDTYEWSGPSSGNSGVASTDFTVELPVGGAVVGTVTVTPGDGGDGGTFTPTTATLTTASPSDTFTYTPASGGAKTLSVTNNGGLTDPDDIIYTVSVPLADGDPVSVWPDSSVNGNDATQTGAARPTYKTSIVNGQPVVRFASANSQFLTLTTPISSAVNYTAFAVMQAGATNVHPSLCGAAGTAAFASFLITNSIYSTDTAGTIYTAGANIIWNIWTSRSDTGGLYQNGSVWAVGFAAASTAGNLTRIGRDDGNGDTAEIIIYSGILSGTDRVNVEKYLSLKYGIAVAGGSAVQPDTVTGLLGWWKADSL